MFVVDMPPGRELERTYAIDVVLGRFMGLEVRVQTWSGSYWRLRHTATSDEASSIALPDVFFRIANDAWLASTSLPRERVGLVERNPGSLPLIFSSSVDCAAGAEFCFDVFGAAFFMLTRYEERITTARDQFNRFPARASCLWGIVDVNDPFIDRAVEALRERIERTWPSVSCRRPVYELRVTHDVDALRNQGRPWGDIIVACGADVVRRRDPGLAIHRLRAAVRRRTLSLDPQDPFNTFDFIMTESERLGIQSHFYFVPEPHSPYDPDYNIVQADVANLLRQIGERGHLVGLHAGFGAAFEEGGIAREFALLRQAAERAGIRQDEWGGRHHFLRWRPEVSWYQWAQAGLDYDSSVGYAEMPGFRCGTSQSYPVWDFEARKVLNLLERPLVLMESTLFAHQGLTDDAALRSCMEVAARCRRVGGTLVFLWHNHNLLTSASRDLYRAVLSEARKAN